MFIGIRSMEASMEAMEASARNGQIEAKNSQKSASLGFFLVFSNEP